MKEIYKYLLIDLSVVWEKQEHYIMTICSDNAGTIKFENDMQKMF